jgi:hypothetical protein
MNRLAKHSSTALIFGILALTLACSSAQDAANHTASDPSTPESSSPTYYTTPESAARNQDEIHIGTERLMSGAVGSAIRLVFLNDKTSDQDIERILFGEKPKPQFGLAAKGKPERLLASDLLTANLSVREILLIDAEGNEKSIASYGDVGLLIDLVSLDKGSPLDLGGIAIPVGTYQGLKLRLNPMNSVTLNRNGTIVQEALTMLGSHDSLKINRGFSVSPTAFTSFMLSIDLKKSIKYNKNHGWQLKPVLKLRNLSEKSIYQKSCQSFVAMAGPTPDALATFDALSTAIDAAGPGWIIMVGDLNDSASILVKEKEDLFISTDCRPAISNINVIKSRNIRLNGFTVRAGSNEAAISIHGANLGNEDISLSSLTIKGNRSGTCVDVGSKNTGVALENLVLEDCGEGISIAGDAKVSLKNSQIERSIGNGIVVDSGAQLSVLLSSIKYSMNNAIVLKEGTQLRIEMSTLERNGAGGDLDNGYAVKFPSLYDESRLLITDSRFFANNGRVVAKVSSQDFSRLDVFEDSDARNSSSSGVESNFSNGAQEGTLAFDNGVKINITNGSIPSGTRTSDIEVDLIDVEVGLPASLIDAHNAFGQGVRFSPEVSRFANTVIAEIPFPEADAPILEPLERYALAYHNKVTNQLEVVPTAVVDGVAYAKLEHFSDYYFIVVFSPVPRPLAASEDQIRNMIAPQSWKYNLKGYPYFELMADTFKNQNSCQAVRTGDNVIDFLFINDYLKGNNFGLTDFLDPEATLWDVSLAIGFERVEGAIMSQTEAFLGRSLSDLLAGLLTSIINEAAREFLQVPLVMNVRKDCAAFAECMSFKDKDFAKCAGAKNPLAGGNPGLLVNFGVSCLEQAFVSAGLTRMVDKYTARFNWPYKQPANTALKSVLGMLKVFVTSIALPGVGPSVYFQAAGSCAIDGAVVTGVLAADYAAHGRMRNWVPQQDDFNNEVKSVLASPYCPFENQKFPGSYYYRTSSGEYIGFKELDINLPIGARYMGQNFSYPSNDYISIMDIKNKNGADIGGGVFDTASQSVQFKFRPQQPNDYATVGLMNNTTKETNSCVAILSDTPMQLETHEFQLACESGSTSGNVRKSCEAQQCFLLERTNGSDGAIIDATFTVNRLRGSDDPSCSAGTYSKKYGFNNTQYLEICFQVKARSEEGGWDGKGHSGIADCTYRVDFIRTSSTSFTLY